MTRIDVHLRNADATAALGARLSRVLSGGMIVTLSGDLGTGKTTLVRGLLRALGWTGPVKSPTYTLVEHYPFSSLYFYHFDFYRFNDPEEWETAGLSECFRADSVCLVEWPERVGTLLPQADLMIALAYPAQPTAEGREANVLANTPAGDLALRAMSELPAMPEPDA